MKQIKIQQYFLLIFLFIHLNIFSQPVLPVCKHQFIVIAHRGDHTHAPENTLAAYQNAIDAGADFVEIDLRTTKDSQLVIMHDATIDRMTENKGRISDLMFDSDSLRQIKVIEKSHIEWGFHSIPTFKEVLQLCKGKINIYLDFKEASVSAAYKEIENAGMEKNVVVYINALHHFMEWRRVAPQMPLMISLTKKINTQEEMFQFLDKVKVEVLDGNFNEYTKETVLAAKEKKVPVWADIQSSNESDNWEKALQLNLEGLQTDHPKNLIEYLKKKGIR